MYAMRAVREVCVLLGLLSVLVCAWFDVRVRTRRRFIDVTGSRDYPGGFGRCQGGGQIGA